MRCLFIYYKYCLLRGRKISPGQEYNAGRLEAGGKEGGELTLNLRHDGLDI